MVRASRGRVRRSLCVRAGPSTENPPLRLSPYNPKKKNDQHAAELSGVLTEDYW